MTTLTIAQVSERLGLCQRYVQDLAREGKIPAFKRGLRYWGVDSDKLEQWIRERGNSNKLSGLAGNTPAPAAI